MTAAIERLPRSRLCPTRLVAPAYAGGGRNPTFQDSTAGSNRVLVGRKQHSAMSGWTGEVSGGTLNDLTSLLKE